MSGMGWNVVGKLDWSTVYGTDTEDTMVLKFKVGHDACNSSYDRGNGGDSSPHAMGEKSRYFLAETFQPRSCQAFVSLDNIFDSMFSRGVVFTTV